MAIDQKEVDLIIRTKLQGKASLDDVTKGIDALSKRIDEQVSAAKRGENSITDLIGAEKKLKQAQDELGTQASIIGAFQRAGDAAGKMSERVQRAAKSYADYKAKLDGVASVTDEQQARLLRLSAAHQRALTAQAQQQAQLATLTDAMRKAGIASNNLADAETRVRTAAALIGAQVAKARDAISTYEDRTKGAAGAVNTLGRASTDLRPRIVSVSDAMRTIQTGAMVSQVLALTAAYTGLHSAVGLAGKAADAFSTREGVKNQLALSVGTSKQAIDAEYAYVKAQADRIGIEFETATKGYAKFSAAATLAGRSRQEIRYIFEAFTEVARVANLSKEDLAGVFKALEQIISKGKIQAEELRGQLGDRLFGAFQVAAQALKDVYPDLDKALKDGVVTSDQLIVIAEKYRETVGGQLAEAASSLASKQARLNNAIADFRLVVADGGFADAYANLLERLTDYLRSADGQKFAKDVSAAFAAVADALVYVLAHMAELKLGLSIIAGLWAGSKLKAVAGGFGDLGKAIRSAASDAGLLTKAFVALQAFAVGFSIGTYLYDQFAIVRKAGAILVVSYELAWSKIVHGAMLAFEQVPVLADNAFKAVANSATKGTRTLLTILASAARAIGNTGLADSIQEAIAKITLIPAEGTAARVKQIRQAAAEDEKRIRDIGMQMIADADAARSGDIGPAAVPATPTPKPASTPRGKAGTTDAEIAKRQHEVDAITRALEIIEAKIDRAQTDSLAKQLDAIDVEYKALARRVKELGGKDSADFLGKLNDAVGQLKLQTVKKFNDKLLAESEALQAKIEAAEAAAGRKNKNELDGRLKAVSDSYAATYRDIAQVRQDLQQNDLSTAPADESKRRLDAAVLELQRLERLKFAREELTRLEARYNDQIRLRDGLIAAVRAQQDAGNIDETAAAREINRINQEALPAILAAAQATREWATENQAVFATSGDFDLFIAQIDATIAKVRQVQNEFTKLEKTAINGAVRAIDSGLGSMYDNLGKVLAGQQSVGEGFKSMGKAFLQFAADFLREIALMIVKQAIFNAMKESGGVLGNIGKAGLASMGAGVGHSGGIAGSLDRTRNVPRAWFANAPRYHKGGFVGMSPNEVPAVLQRGEEILSASNPRNVLNGGLTAGKPQGDVVIKNILIDDRSRVPEAMASDDGERVIMQAVKRNLPALRQLIKAG